MQSKYSGRTSAFVHKRGDWKEADVSKIPEAIQQVTVFEAQWTNCPIEVENEVRQLWRDWEFGNDHYYLPWEGEEMGEDYPIIHEYLTSKGITNCLIHWWW